jgi:hypothetical protein
MNERTLILAKLILSHMLLIIGFLSASLCTSKYAFLLLAITQTVLCILFLAGYWEFFGLKIKGIFCGLIELLIGVVFAFNISSSPGESPNLIVVILFAAVLAGLVFALVKILGVMFIRDPMSVNIEFPFKRGLYLITDGGNSRISRLMNYHYYSRVHKRNNTNNSMLYATDIVKLKNEGMLFLPRTNEAYPVFNEKMYAPIDGLVIKAENDIPDNKPYSGNYPYNTGNTVVIRKGDLYLLLGHLKQGSIRVKEGDQIQAGDLIGTAGNSGWTERPHLHMQLIKSDSNNYWFGKGVCIRYKNKNLYKNRLIRIL